MPPQKLAPLTVAEQFEFIADDVKWFIPRLLKRDADGQLSRMAVVQGLAELEQQDTHADIHYGDDAGRRWLAEYLAKYGTSRLDADSVAEGIRQSLARFDPLHVAKLIDGAIPPYETEQRGGKVEDKLNTAIADREVEISQQSPKGSGAAWPEPADVKDSESMQFSEQEADRIVRKMFSRVRV